MCFFKFHSDSTRVGLFAFSSSLLQALRSLVFDVFPCIFRFPSIRVICPSILRVMMPRRNIISKCNCRQVFYLSAFLLMSAVCYTFFSCTLLQSVISSGDQSAKRKFQLSESVRCRELCSLLGIGPWVLPRPLPIGLSFRAHLHVVFYSSVLCACEVSPFWLWALPAFPLECTSQQRCEVSV